MVEDRRHAALKNIRVVSGTEDIAWVSHVHQRDEKWSNWDHEQADIFDAIGLANAQLIAAAPDLLAACQRILAAWNSVPDNVQVPDEINDDAAWLFLETAIAKATGEQP